MEVPLVPQEGGVLYAPDGSSIRLPSPEVLSEFRKLIGGAKIAITTLDDDTARVRGPGSCDRSFANALSSSSRRTL